MTRFHSFLFCLFFVFLFTGCGRNFWLAKYYVYVAEQHNYKAHVLRTKKEAQAEMLKYQRKSCECFKKAYALDKSVFNFVRCEYASQSCDWVGDMEGAQFFRTVQQNYQEPEEMEPAPLPSS